MDPYDEIRKELADINTIQRIRDGHNGFRSLCDSLPEAFSPKVLTTEIIDGWSILPVPASFEDFLLDSMLLVENYAELPEKPLILDAGAGSAETLAFMTQSLGGDGYGIELSPMVAVYAKRRLRQLKTAGWLTQDCQVVQGNYFPADMDVAPEVKWLKIPEHRRSHLDNDPYAQLGKQLSDFDLIYFYQFIVNTDITLRMISQYCKPGAHIIFPDYAAYSGLHNVIIPGNLQLVAKLNNPALFVKKGN